MTIENIYAFASGAGSRRARPHTPIPTGTLQKAIALVDASGVASLLTSWATKDGRMIREMGLSPRQVLAVWIALGFTHRALTNRNATSVLTEDLTPTKRRALGLTDEFSMRTPDQVERMVRRATQKLIESMDAFPNPTRRRRLTKSEWEDVLAQRASFSFDLEKRRQRFLMFANRLLEAQHRAARVSDSAEGVSVVVDNRFRSAGVRGVSRRRMAGLGASGRVSAEPDAGYFEADLSGRQEYQPQLGWEDQLAVLISNDAEQPNSVPNIVIGFNWHRPAVGFAHAAVEVLSDIAGRSAGLDHVVVDRAYMATRPDLLRTPLLNLGAKLVGDYPANRQGVQAVSATGVLIDGTWYAPSLPAHLQNAGRDFLRTVDTLRDRIETMKELKEFVAARAEFSRCHPHVPADTQAERDEQYYPYRSGQWRKVYGMGRGAFEAYVAASAVTERNESGHRRMRGATAQAFLSVLNIIGTNARILEDFHAAQRRPHTRTEVVPPLMTDPATQMAGDLSVRRPKRPRRSVLSCPALGMTTKKGSCIKREAGN